MNIRLATAGDVAAVAALHAASWRVAYRGLLSDAYLDEEIGEERAAKWSQRLNAPRENQYVVLAEEEGRLAGFACAYLGDDSKWGALLDNLHVSEGLQRRGVGRLLMKAVAARCLAADASGLYLWVLQSNTPARRFYERLGARNREGGLWTAPGGGALPRRRYVWRDARVILNTPDWTAGTRPLASGPPIQGRNGCTRRPQLRAACTERRPSA